MKTPVKLPWTPKPFAGNFSASASFVCHSCRKRATHRAPTVPLFTTSTRRYADSRRSNDDPENDESSWSARTRRKIWGTDAPPGQKDPYAPKGAPGSEPNAPPKPKTQAGATSSQDFSYDTYVPAVTTEGLDQIGGPSGWWEEAWDEENPFTSFVQPLVCLVTVCLHGAALHFRSACHQVRPRV